MGDMQEHLSISMKELKKAVSILHLSCCTSQFLQCGMRSLHYADSESWQSILTTIKESVLLACCNSRPKLHLLAPNFHCLSVRNLKNFANPK